MASSLPIAPTLALDELAIVTIARFVQMIAYRIIYPLLPFLALRLGVDLQMASLLVTMQVAVSLFSPLGGALAAAFGQRAAMSVGLLLFCAGTGLCALSATFLAFLAGYVLIGLGVTFYHPAAQSYLSARTSYARRGFALGIYEVSWAAAALVGIAPLMYLVGETHQPQIVFVVLLAGGVVSLLIVRLLLPPALAGARIEAPLRGALRAPGAWALLAMFVLVLWGADLVFVVQSAWLNQRFGANEALVGLVFAMQGGAELLGSSGSALLVDRVGKKRSLLLGFGLMAAAALLLPLTAGVWLLFLPIFFLFDLGFEFGIVSSFPLASGVAPAARSALLALCTVAVGLGRTAGTLVAEPLWRVVGIGANTTLSAMLIVLGLVLCWRFVHATEAEHA